MNKLEPEDVPWLNHEFLLDLFCAKEPKRDRGDLEDLDNEDVIREAVKLYTPSQSGFALNRLMGNYRIEGMGVSTKDLTASEPKAAEAMVYLVGLIQRMNDEDENKTCVR